MDGADIDSRFSFYPADADKGRRHAEVRERCANLGLELNELLPDSREKSLAITRLEEVMMWANAAIARNP